MENSIEKIRNKWGQTHEELCANLGYDENESDDLIMLDYVWDESGQVWLTKNVDDENEQEIIDNINNF